MLVGYAPTRWLLLTDDTTSCASCSIGVRLVLTRLDRGCITVA